MVGGKNVTNGSLSRWGIMAGGGAGHFEADGSETRRLQIESAIDVVN